MIRAAAMLGLVLATAGGEVRFMTVGDVLYVAVSGAGKGLAHVYVAGGKRTAGG
ncbi:MAG TPA: hypothetical protein VKU85_12095 [bacterium]|nr:hypothetical protein [bacterium]